PDPPDPDNPPALEAGPPAQRPVDSWLRNDRSVVVGLTRPAIQDTHIEGRVVPVNRGNPVPDRLARLVRVLRLSDFAGADRPYRLRGRGQPGPRMAPDAPPGPREPGQPMCAPVPRTDDTHVHL